MDKWGRVRWAKGEELDGRRGDNSMGVGEREAVVGKDGEDVASRWFDS